eukprot:1146308-Pelagomonas_calceolata.AAC.4
MQGVNERIAKLEGPRRSNGEACNACMGVLLLPCSLQGMDECIAKDGALHRGDAATCDACFCPKSCALHCRIWRTA